MIGTSMLSGLKTTAVYYRFFESSLSGSSRVPVPRAPWEFSSAAISAPAADAISERSALNTPTNHSPLAVPPVAQRSTDHLSEGDTRTGGRAPGVSELDAVSYTH